MDVFEKQDKSWREKLLDTKSLTTMGVLLATEIVLSRFLSITAWNLKIGFSFVPVVIAAMLYGSVGGAIVAGLGDLLGALLFPIGPFFPGFTLTAILTGLTFGLFLHKTRSFRNTIFAVLIVQLVLGLFLNTFWISLLYGSPFRPLLMTRAVQAAILAVVQTVTIRLIVRLSDQYLGRLAV